MVKKIKKYAKFVVCMALIMGLIAPSYAALSASDGSAFVTKAEFDSALADFNARLTTFEAGINSKIDSQVTSYLDRNGIWNGKIQTLDVQGQDLLATAPELTLKDNGDRYTITYESDVLSTKIVSSITKSGLAFVSMQYSASQKLYGSSKQTTPNALRWGYTCHAVAPANWFLDQAMLGSFVFRETAENSAASTLYNTVVLSTFGSLESGAEAAKQTPACPVYFALPPYASPSSYNVIFFVKKGTPLYFVYNLHAHFDYVTDATLKPKSAVCANLNFRFNNISVY